METGYVLCLRTVNKDGTAYEGFKWPEKGLVEAPDWSPAAKCGHGLHGYLKGCGDGDQIKWDGLFQVVKVIEGEIVDLDGKVKFPRCEVIFTGSQKDATDILVKEYPGLPVIGAFVVAGDNMVAAAGVWGTATAGEYGTAAAGNCGAATAGHGGMATAGNRGTATAGRGGMATAGDHGTATAGDSGTATAGYCGTATASLYGTATAGDRGKATAGEYGTATAGYYGTATAGIKGRLSILYWDCASNRCREVIGYVGEDGIEANITYKLDSDHKFVKA